MLHQSSYSLKFLTALSLVLALFLPACKKDKAGVESGLTGTWVTLESQNGAGEYYLFTGDKKLYKLRNSPADYPEVEYFLYDFKNNQVTIQGGSQFGAITVLYNVRFAGDTVFFNDGNDDVTTLLKDNLAPKQVSDWTTPLTVTERFTDTVQTRSIAYYSGKLYTFKYYSDAAVSKLIEYNPATRNVSSVTLADQSYSGFDFAPDGTLWCVNWEYAYIFNPATGMQTFQSASVGSNSLWATAVGNGVLYSYESGAYIPYDIAGNSWGQTRPVNNDVTDMAYADGYVYVAKAGMLYQKHTYYTETLKSWYLENYEILGVAHATGNDFWLAARNKATGVSEMLKVTL